MGLNVKLYWIGEIFEVIWRWCGTNCEFVVRLLEASFEPAVDRLKNLPQVFFIQRMIEEANRASIVFDIGAATPEEQDDFNNVAGEFDL